jgi:hypothetical protein
VFPAILRRSIAFTRAIYAPLAILHISLVLRLLADLKGWSGGRQVGGILSAVAIVAYLGITVRSLRPRRVAPQSE